MSATGIRNDPFPAFNFYVSLIESAGWLQKAVFGSEQVSAGGFTECTGLEATMTLEDYTEGGLNSYVHKFMTRMTYSNIVLKRGMTFSDELWRWHADFVSGKGKRTDGLITLVNEFRLPVRSWKFARGLPAKLTGPTLNASQGAVAVETLEIVHEGWQLV
jgi:phage tail-like protein